MLIINEKIECLDKLTGDVYNLSLEGPNNLKFVYLFEEFLHPLTYDAHTLDLSRFELIHISNKDIKDGVFICQEISDTGYVTYVEKDISTLDDLEGDNKLRLFVNLVNIEDEHSQVQHFLVLDY